ncbi:hypothetical protein [Bradyrhizobium sp. USDA 3364]
MRRWLTATMKVVPTAREIAQAEIVADWPAWLGHSTMAGVGAAVGGVGWMKDDGCGAAIRMEVERQSG